MLSQLNTLIINYKYNYTIKIYFYYILLYFLVNLHFLVHKNLYDSLKLQARFFTGKICIYL